MRRNRPGKRYRFYKRVVFTMSIEKKPGVKIRIGQDNGGLGLAQGERDEDAGTILRALRISSSKKINEEDGHRVVIKSLKAVQNDRILAKRKIEVVQYQESETIDFL